MKRILPIGLLLILLMPIAAQDGTDVDVVVTADRIEKEEIETTATVSVISAEEIENSAANSVVELLEALPGVQFRSYSGPAQAAVSMGGFGELSYGRVVVLVNGRVQNNPDMRPINWMSIPLESVERIEVLHGGGGVLYGSGAVGGVINIITRETDVPFELETGARYGSFTTHGEYVQAGASNALGSIRVGGEFYSTEGYRDRSGSNYANANVGGSLYPTDQLDLELDLNYTRSFYEMPGELSKVEYEEDPTQSNNPEDESTEHEFGGTITGTWYASDSLTAEILFGYGYKNMAVDMASWFSYDDRTSSTVDIRPKFVLKTALDDYALTITSGVDLRYSTLHKQSYAELERTTQTGEFEVSLSSVGGFVSGDLLLTDSLGVTAGFRYDMAILEAVNETLGVEDSKLHHSPSWAAALRWNPTENSKLYLRQEGLFRYPFTDEQTDFNGGADPFLEDLEAETGQLYEIGGLYALKEFARIDFRTYLLQMQNEINYVGSWPTGKNENIGQTRRIGFETVLVVAPVEQVEVSGSYSYVLPTFTNGVDKGDQIPLVSNHEVEGAITYTTPVDLDLSLNGSYRSDYYAGGDTSNSQEMIEGYFLLTAGAEWKVSSAAGDFRLQARVENIFDEQYAALVYDYGAYYPGQGRSFTLSGSYSF